MNDYYRSNEVINKIKKTHSDPKIIKNFIQTSDIEKFLSIHDSSTLETPHHGEDLVYRFSSSEINEINEWVHSKFDLPFPYVVDMVSTKENLGNPFDVFHVDKSHRRISEGALNEVLYKTILIPLYVNGDITKCFTCFAKQHYYHHSVYFKYNDDSAKMPFGVNCYDDIDEINYNDEFDSYNYEKYVSHISKNHLYGLQFDCAMQWEYNSCIIFDRTQLHCSNNYILHEIRHRKFIQIQTLALI